ncbi:MAG TPA: hypothetical protein PKK94_05345 [Leptospiraceae bacterium]|nr:hypothetical protein [Leptospiraceae bacterium]
MRGIKLTAAGLATLLVFVLNCEDKPKKAKVLTTTMSVLVDDPKAAASTSTSTDGTSAGTGTTASGTAVTASVSAGNYSVSMPSGITSTASPSGDFTGITYAGNPAEVAGFIGQVPDQGQADSASLSSSLLGIINAAIPTTNLATANVLSSSTSSGSGGSTSIYHLAVTTDSATNVTGLSNLLLQTIGTSITNGTVTNLPTSGGTESTSASFHVVLQVTYSSSGPEVIGVGVSTTANYSANEALLTTFLDGSNISSGTVPKIAKTDTFSGAADPKADFVWVVDNSSSMQQEQSAVSSAATTFFSALSNKRLDYRIGVITTDSSTLRTAGGTSWVVNSTSGGQTAFVANTAAGTGGSGNESATHFAVQGINNGNLTPRSGSKLYFVFVTDEGDSYQCYNGGSTTTPASPTWSPCKNGTSFDTASNVFTQNSYKVFGIIGLDAATGLSGKCTGTNGTSASNNNNQHTNYYNLALATGGSSASICADDFSPIMSSIVNEAAATSSPYVLSKSPISSTINVKVNGTDAAKSSVNGWTYDASSNSIIFSGTAWPSVGASISVTYEYNSSGTAFRSSAADQTLTAYIGNTVNSNAVKIGIGAILLAALTLIGRNYLSKKNR